MLRVTPARALVLFYLTKIEVHALSQCCEALRGLLLQELSVRRMLEEEYFGSTEGFRNLIRENALVVKGPGLGTFLFGHGWKSGYDSYFGRQAVGNILCLVITGTGVDLKVSTVQNFLLLQGYKLCRTPEGYSVEVSFLVYLLCFWLSL